MKRHAFNPAGNPRRHRLGGFTLFEVMLSLILVALLLYGVNKVFTLSSDAVSGGQFINESNRDSRNTQPQLFGDMLRIRNDMPIVICNQGVNQFLNVADLQSAINPANPLAYDLTNSGPVVANANGAPQMSPAICSYRRHRADTISFFATENTRRRTGSTSYLSATTGDDLYVWLGHAAQPAASLSGASASSTYFGPDHYFGPNDPNLNPRTRYGGFASDWVLTRAAILLKDPQSLSASERAYMTQTSGGANLGAATVPPGLNLSSYFNGTISYPVNISPLMPYTPDHDPTYPTVLQNLRYDVAGVTMEQYRQTLANAYSAGLLWWYPWAWRPQQDQAGLSATDPVTGQPKPQMEFSRFWYNPVVPTFSSTNGTPLNQQQKAAAFAQNAPNFLEHASQFVVEFAGDYITQDNNPADFVGSGQPTVYGSMTSAGPDGQIDFTISYQTVNGVPNTPIKTVRWYGLTRLSDGVSILPLGTPVYPAMPLVAVGANSYPASPNTVLPAFVTTGAQDPHYEVSSWGISPISSTSNLPSNAWYVCAFIRPQDMPAMIRILVKVDDPGNRMNEGPWYEYVFRLR